MYVLFSEQTMRAATLIESLVPAPFDSAAAMDTSQFLDALRTLGDLARSVDRLGAVLTAELTRRVQTDADFRREALGGDVGGRFGDELLRELLRIDEGIIRDWDRVGEAIAPRASLQGEVLPCRHEPLAAAVLDGAIGARAASIVARGIDAVADHADLETLNTVETTLVQCAPSLTTRELARVTRTLPDRFDPDGAEPREDQLRARAKVTMRKLPSGIIRFIADMHPEGAGFVCAALDAHTAPRRQVAFTADASSSPDGCTCGVCDSLADGEGSRAYVLTEWGFVLVEAPGELAGDMEGADCDCPPTSNDEVDTRPLSQRRVDALIAVCRESLANDKGTLAGTSVTMLVTVPLEVLQTGVGTAAIAGVDEPICAGTARRLAADAELIPVVLGTDSEVLDLGRSARLFTPAQRRALAARDGGCIWPGCTMPPAWCEVAHLLAWALGGETDLENGALMCPHHHRRFDHDGWALRREHGTPYLIPPVWLDPQQTPRRAGRYELIA
ncbi:HNH endonuclease [Homoserinibacter gongjuensis]|uniref:HNH endonuclease n=1 Tax=Homoserinibacter gongjuensis TaxID=1162968 RepID=A0ABQ6K0I5_9MICO|nr:HNH endonuclease [Homoserinibacter gongjuensis]